MHRSRWENRGKSDLCRDFESRERTEKRGGLRPSPQNRLTPHPFLPTFSSSPQSSSGCTQELGSSRGHTGVWNPDLRGGDISSASSKLSHPCSFQFKQPHPPDPAQVPSAPLWQRAFTPLRVAFGPVQGISLEKATAGKSFSLLEPTRVPVHSGHGKAADPHGLGQGALGMMATRNCLA